jgi:hypothetical protein
MESPSNVSPLTSWPGKRYETRCFNCGSGFWFEDVAERTGPVAFQVTCRKCGYQWQKWEEPPNANPQ